MKFGEGLREWAGRWKAGVRHQVTWSGLAFSLLILIVGLAAFASANNLLFLLLAALLSTMLVSGFVSRLGLAGLEVKLLLPEHVFARRNLPVRIQLHNTKRFMPSFSIHLASQGDDGVPTDIYFPMIAGHTTLEAVSTVHFRRRGIYGDSHYHFITRFPFGFTERRVQVRLRRELLVYPCVDPQDGFEELLISLEGDLESYLQGRGHDFHRIRPYEALESARHVDWKATAHTRELQVREFAREEDHLVEIFLDLNVGPEEEDWLDRAVDACAFLCWRLAERSSRLRFVTQNAEVRLPETGGIYTILKYLAKAEPFRARVPVFPNEPGSFKILFSLFAEPHREAGWHLAHIVGLDAFPGSRRRADVDNGSGQQRAGARTAAGPQLGDRGRQGRD